MESTSEDTATDVPPPPRTAFAQNNRPAGMDADAPLTWQQPAPEDAPGVSQLEAPQPAAAPLDSPVQETPAKVSAPDVPPQAALQVGTSSGDSLAEGRSDSDDDDDDDD